MRVTVVDHPVVAAKLTALRDITTDTPTFRRLVDDLVTLLAYEATRSVSVEPVEITTPITTTTGVRLTSPPPLVVPVLRAGVGMLDGLTRLLPDAEVGFAGLMRDETTAQPSWYAERLPESAAGRAVFVLDPMLATGGTLVAVVEALLGRGAEAVTCVCLLAAPEGIAGCSRCSRTTGCPWLSRRSTSGSTSGPTSCPASATPAIACSAAHPSPSPHDVS